jgi:DnaK suppressor protein
MSDDKMELTLKQKIAPYELVQGEPYMNDRQLRHFKNILEQWKDQLMRIVDQTISELQQTDVSADPNDRATQEEEFSVKLRTRDRERKLLKKIEETLNQIDEKEYGYCETCGIDIGIRRLEARPTATLCIDCKSLAEIKEKRS